MKESKCAILSVIIVLLIFMLYAFIQTEWSKTHSIVYNIDKYCYEHECGYRAEERYDVNGERWFHCTGCGVNVYK